MIFNVTGWLLFGLYVLAGVGSAIDIDDDPSWLRWANTFFATATHGSAGDILCLKK